jgi:hypothetical protein
MNQMNLKTSVLNCLEAGMDVEFEKVSICDLSRSLISRKFLPRRYQVYSKVSSPGFNGYYSEIDEAVDKFIGLYTFLTEEKDASVN